MGEIYEKDKKETEYGVVQLFRRTASLQDDGTNCYKVNTVRTVV